MKSIHSLIFSLFLCLSCLCLQAQPGSLKGTVRDASGQAIPNALLLCSDSETHFYCDSLGNFFLPARGQKHYLKVLAPGYVPKNIVLPFNYKESLLIYLEEVSPKGKFNPYEVIRLAQIKREENKLKYSHFDAQVFKTAKADLHKVLINIWPLSGLFLPKKTDTGLIYFSEQIAGQKFYGTYNFSDKVKAFHAGGTLPVPDFTYISDKNLSLLHKKISFPEIGPQQYFTPLSPRAKALYDFEDLGIYLDNGRKIYRIGFAPKKKGSATMSGYIEIYDSTYTIAYANFKFTTENHLETVDSIRVKQFYYYRDTVYQQALQQTDFYLNILGYAGSYSVSSYFNTHRFIPKSSTHEVGREVFFMDSLSVIDSANFWKEHRIRALSDREKRLLAEENLNELFREKYSRELYLQKPFKPLNLLYERYVYKEDGYYFNFSPLYYALGYNTVEGAYLHYELPIRLYGKDHEWMLKPEVRMGFGDGEFKSRMMGGFTYDLSNPKKVSFEVGHVFDQFNENEPISPLINSIYSLFLSKNHMKLYGKDYAKLGYQLEIINGLELQSSMEFASRFAVYNHSDFVISGNPEEFTPNNPDEAENISAAGFDDHQALTFRAQLAYQFHQLYKTINGKKVKLRMNTPRVYLNFKKGMETNISETKFSFLAAGITLNTELGNLGHTIWDFSGGGFLNSDRMEFIDYKHFNGTQTFYLQSMAFYHNPIKQFSTLGYYNYSTKNAFLEAHFEHHFDGFLLSRIPLLRKSDIHTFMGMNYLNNFTRQQFWEPFIGFDNIFGIMRVEIAAGTQNFSQMDPTFLIGIDFNYLYYLKNKK